MNYVYVIILSLATIALSTACGSTPPDGSGGDGGAGTNNPASTGTGEVETCPADYPTACGKFSSPPDASDYTEWMTVCVDLQTDWVHCGSCDTTCEVNGVFAACAKGVCQFPDAGPPT